MGKIGCDKIIAGMPFEISEDFLKKNNFKKSIKKKSDKIVYTKWVGLVNHVYTLSYRYGTYHPYYTIIFNPNKVLFNTNTCLCTDKQFDMVMKLVDDGLEYMNLLSTEINIRNFNIIRLDACFDYHTKNSLETLALVNFMKVQYLPYTKVKQEYETSSYHVNKSTTVLSYDKREEVKNRILKGKATPEDILWFEQNIHLFRMEIQKNATYLNDKYNTRKVGELFNMKTLHEIFQDTIYKMNLHKPAYSKTTLDAIVDCIYSKTKAKNIKNLLEQWNLPVLTSEDKEVLRNSLYYELRKQNLQLTYASPEVIQFLKKLISAVFDFLPLPFKKVFTIYNIKPYFRKILNLYFYEDGGG